MSKESFTREMERLLESVDDHYLELQEAGDEGDHDEMRTSAEMLRGACQAILDLLASIEPFQEVGPHLKDDLP